MSNTKEKIIEKALELYNKQGIEYIGVRELAQELGTKAGNITYYFPTKDDLVAELSRMLNVANNKVVAPDAKITLAKFMEMFKAAFHNQYTYRCLLLSLPHLFKQNEVVREEYKKRSVARKETIIIQIKYLIANGYIRKLTEDEIAGLFNNIQLYIRFWIGNASVEGELTSMNKAIKNNIGTLACMLSFVATTKGKKDLESYLV